MALKLMIPKATVDEYSRESFLREAENTRALRHPNIVQRQDWGFSNGVFFFSLEHCDRGSVDHLMQQRGGTLPVSEALELTLQALDGLEYAHNAAMPYVKLKEGGFAPGTGLVHRDLKPSNVFLSSAGNRQIAKLGDYGLSKAFGLAGLSGLTVTGIAWGTAQFMPRQQAVNFKYAKPEVDVWAMAACMYNMLTAHYPRDFSASIDPVQVLLNSDAIPIKHRDSSIPTRLAEVIDSALMDRPEIHFKTAAQLKEALEGAV